MPGVEDAKWRKQLGRLLWRDPSKAHNDKKNLRSKRSIRCSYTKICTKRRPGEGRGRRKRPIVSVHRIGCHVINDAWPIRWIGNLVENRQIVFVLQYRTFFQTLEPPLGLELPISLGCIGRKNWPNRKGFQGLLDMSAGYKCQQWEAKTRSIMTQLYALKQTCFLTS